MKKTINFKRLLYFFGILIFVGVQLKAQNCNASFTYSIGANGLVTFQNTSNGYSPTATFNWYFGDSWISGTNFNETHQYQNNGTYSAYLFINDSLNSCADNYSVSINITNVPCQVNADFNSQLGQNGLVNFHSTSVLVATNTVSTIYNWDFGDGTNSNNPYSTSHTYSSTGIYSVSLTVSDTAAAGCSGTITQTINVAIVNCSLTANFTYTIVNGNELYFQNTSSGTGASTYYYWSFSDGTASQQENPVKIFSSWTGSTTPTYVVTLMISDSSQAFQCTSMMSQTVNLTGYYPCNATALVSSAGWSCWQFQNNSSGVNLSYHWDFGDGTTANTVSPHHCYTDSLNYHNVFLIINGDGGCSDTTMLTVYDSIPHTPAGCSAQFTYWIDSTNCSIHFVNLSNNSGGSEWHINNQTYTQFTPPVLTYTASPVNVSLYSYYAGQVCDTMHQVIYLPNSCLPSGGSICNASFVLFPDSTNSNTYYAFDQSIGSGLNYLWDFGDGTTSTQQYPTHIYSTSGNYVVCLTVTNSSCTSTSCDSNNVQRISSSALMKTLIAKPRSQTGIKFIYKSINLSIFPNPANDFVSIDSDKELKAIELFDITGKKIYSVSEIRAFKYQISLSSFEPGTYFMQLYAKDGFKIQRKIMKF